MQHDELIGQVQADAQLGSRGAAEAAVRATLDTLAERLAGGLPENLGAQLPGDLGRHLAQDGAGEDFGAAEFHDRVAAREPGSVSREVAAHHVVAVLGALDRATEHDALGRIRDQLPSDYEPVFADVR